MKTDTPQGTPPASNGLAVTSGSALRIFQQREIRAAYEYAATGGQALHLMDGSFAHMQARTPSCFKGRRQIAHLFDQDRARLVSTAKRAGVRVILVEYEGTPRQHIDLCGKPLERVTELAKQVEWERDHGLLPQNAEISHAEKRL